MFQNEDPVLKIKETMSLYYYSKRLNMGFEINEVKDTVSFILLGKSPGIKDLSGYKINITGNS